MKQNPQPSLHTNNFILEAFAQTLFHVSNIDLLAPNIATWVCSVGIFDQSRESAVTPTPLGTIKSRFGHLLALGGGRRTRVARGRRAFYHAGVEQCG
jgi:hypothetical protein